MLTVPNEWLIVMKNEHVVEKPIGNKSQQNKIYVQNVEKVFSIADQIVPQM